MKKIYGFLASLLLLLRPSNVVGLESNKEKPRMILDFTADWCSPCKLMKNIWNNDEVKAELEARKTDFLEIDIDKNQNSAKIWGVNAVPCVVMVELDKDGKAIEIKRFIGLKNKGFVLQWLK